MLYIYSQNNPSSSNPENKPNSFSYPEGITIRDFKFFGMSFHHGARR